MRLVHPFSRPPRPARPRFRPTVVELEPRLLLSADVLTFHNDNGRTGQNLAETTLAPGNVTASAFGKLFTDAVDGAVYAQPLIKSNVTVPGQGTLNLVFVATEHDSVYAFNADRPGAPVWHDSFINPAAGVTTVANTDISSSSIGTEVGITGTPVIDASTSTLYVVAFTKEVSGATTTYVQRLHALNLATGAEKFGGPIVIQAAVPGTGQGSSGGVVSLDAFHENQRPGLLLDNGVVYIAWASFDDHTPYHGWVIGYNAQTLQQVAVFNTTPNGGLGGIWLSGGGPAADASGNIYVITGNGTFDASSATPPNNDYGDSFLKLSPTASGLSLASSFTPFNQAVLDARDEDLGSGGPILLPDQSGPNTHLMIGAGKEGKIYVLNRDSLGGFDASTDHVVQELPSSLTALFGTPAYFNGQVYFGGDLNPLTAFTLTNGLLSSTPASQTSVTFGYPGTTPSISANGSANGIVWVVQNEGTAVLRAYRADNLATELYDSNQAGSRDQPGDAVKFEVPTVANGKVYVATQSGVAVFGLRNDVVVPGTPGNDTLTVAQTAGGTSGDITYVLNGGPPVSLTGVTSLTFNGQGGNDTVTVNMTSGIPLTEGSGPITFVAGAGTSTLNVNAVGRAVQTMPGTITVGTTQSVIGTNVATININNAAAVNAAAGPDTADRATALVGLTANEHWVQTVYLDDLGRSGSHAELDIWSAYLDGTTATRTGVASAIAHSGEAEDHLVKSWYVHYLGRQAAGGEEQGWVNALAAGQSPEQVLAGILASVEFQARAQSLIQSGSADQRLVQALYQLLLDRTATDSELAGWTSTLPTLGPQGMALDFLTSTEFRMDQADGYYQALLHRPSDAPYLPSWAASTFNLVQLEVAFESSPEFFSNG
jgi:hypothetical protein